MVISGLCSLYGWARGPCCVTKPLVTSMHDHVIRRACENSLNECAGRRHSDSGLGNRFHILSLRYNKIISAD